MYIHLKALNAAVIIILTAASCKSDPADVPQPLCITFDAVSERGATTTGNISDFAVSAYTGMTPIMDHVTVVRTGSNSWHYSPAVTWPGTPVSFYAVSPADVPFEINLSWENTIKVEKLDGKTDMLISTCLDVIQSSSRLRLNFRHILSYIEVRIRSGSPDCRIIVKKVSVKGVATSGHYFFPKATTSPGNDVRGRWSSWGSDADYTLYEASPDPLVLTPAYTDLNGSGINFMIPSVLDPITGNWGGARIEVAYRVLDPVTGAVLWPDASTPYEDLFTGDRTYAAALYPLGSDIPGSQWQAGEHYIYSLTLRRP